MNWEESKCATPIKRDFLRQWFAREQRFFLTGGSALGLFYLEHRHSYDLDLFTVEEVAGKEVENLVFRIAEKIGAACETLRTSPDFRRFKLSRGDEREIIDVVMDRAPQLQADKCHIDGIRVDTLREIIANKLTTLLGRTEIKDLVDLYFLDQAGHDLIAAVPDARAKDGGWEPAVVAMLLEGMELNDVPDWMVRPLELDAFHAFVKRLRLAFADLALPSEEG